MDNATDSMIACKSCRFATCPGSDGFCDCRITGKPARSHSEPGEWPDGCPNSGKPGTGVVQITVKRTVMVGARNLWDIIHARPLTFEGGVAAELEFIASIAGMVPCGSCREHWVEWLGAHSPDLTSAESYARWTLEAHNAVNKRLSVDEWSLDQACERWGWASRLKAHKKGEHESLAGH